VVNTVSSTQSVVPERGFIFQDDSMAFEVLPAPLDISESHAFHGL